MAESRPSAQSGVARPWFRALLIALLLTVAAALLFWRAGGAGVGIAARSPAPGARDVSGLAPVRVRFAAPMDTTKLPDILLKPELSGTTAVTGTLRWENETTLVLRPVTSLLPDTTYRIEVGPGATSAGGRALKRPLRWRFTTRPARILAMGWDAQDRTQLYLLDAQGAPRQQLTTAEQRVVDYALAPDGAGVVFSSERADGGSDLWQLALDAGGARGEAALLLDCEGDYCIGPQYAPGGERLLYERRAVAGPGETPDPPRLWWLAPGSGQTTPLFSDDQLLGHAPRFSADGTWLAFVVPLVQATQLYNFESGDLLVVENEVGEPVAWHPWRHTFLYSNIQYEGETFSVHLFRMALPDTDIFDMSGDVITNDAAPAWSPDGQWIVFGRRLPRTPQGRQLWLMRAGGGQSMPLTDDVNSNFGRPSWSADGSQILVQRFLVNEPNSDPGIWLVDVDDGELHEVAGSGFLPTWLP